MDVSRLFIWRRTMNERTVLSTELKVEVFRQYYYLKEELVQFCRENNLPASGSKGELTERIANFLETGKIQPTVTKRKATTAADEITESTLIEENIVCSEKHRAFFKEKIVSRIEELMPIIGTLMQ